VTAKTRRRVFLCVLVLALTVPAETILLRALQTTDSTVAVQQWASSLDSSDLQTAARAIEQYPFVYRKAIMVALTPTARAAVWQNHIRAYEKAHPEFDANTLAVLDAAASAITPEAVSAPTATTRASIDAVAAHVVTLLGRDQATYLLYALGPRDGTFQSAEPISMRLENYVRDAFVAFARGGDCDCSTSFGCYDSYTTCDGGTSCTPDETWPMCGWAWDETCNSQCRSGA
jgi:hypothetical protein